MNPAKKTSAAPVVDVQQLVAEERFFGGKNLHVCTPWPLEIQGVFQNY